MPIPKGLLARSLASHAVDQLWKSIELAWGTIIDGIYSEHVGWPVKLPEPLDTSPQRQPHDRKLHHEAQYRNL
jgi:hypothetical protein